MSFTFLSYKREDEARVARLAEALQAAGLEVWWDRGLPGGENWHAEIEAKLAAAGCIVVVWSRSSVAPDGYYVRDEARRGLDRGVLVPVVIDAIGRAPLGFGEVQAIDLRRWHGAAGDPFFQDLVATIRAKLDRRPEPALQGPLRRIRRRLWLGGGISATTFALLLILAVNAFGVTAKVCDLPGLQPGLSDACGALHLGGRPTRAERLAWQALPSGDCQALRAHIDRFPNGAYRDEAQALLTARQVTRGDAWTRTLRPLPLLASTSANVRPTRAAAQALRLAEAQAQADAMCRSFAASTLFRFVSATPVAESWSCERQGGGVACGFDGRADCTLDERQTVERETCGRPGVGE